MRYNFFTLIVKSVALVLIITFAGFAWATQKEPPKFVGYVVNLDGDGKCFQVKRGQTTFKDDSVTPGMPLQVNDEVIVTCGSITIQDGTHKETLNGKKTYTVKGTVEIDAGKSTFLTEVWNTFQRARYTLVATTFTGMKNSCDKTVWEDLQQTIVAGQRSLYIGLNRECHSVLPSKVELCSPTCKPVKYEKLHWNKELLGDVMISADFVAMTVYTVKMSWGDSSPLDVAQFKAVNEPKPLPPGINGSISSSLQALWLSNKRNEWALEAYQKVVNGQEPLEKVAKTVIGFINKEPPRRK